MSHHIYTTDAFVIRGIDSGESNKYVWFFTRELGVVGAVASGARTLKSKTRFGLASGARAMASFVRGRDVWRLASIIPSGASLPDAERARVFFRLLFLVRRLSPHEGRQTELFDFFIRMFASFKREEFSTQDTLSCVEKIAALSILRAFGYGTNDKALSFFSQCPDIDSMVLETFKPMAKKALREINSAIKHSHL